MNSASKSENMTAYPWVMSGKFSYPLPAPAPLNSFILPHLHKSYYFNNIYKLLYIYAQNILLLRKAKRIWFKKMNETFPFQLHIFTSFYLSNTGSKRCSTMIINQKAISSKINFYNLILDYLICQNRSVLLMVTWIEQ